jgi:hypothetical protein
MFWPIALILVVVSVILYLFGFLDHLAGHLGLTVSQTVGFLVLWPTCSVVAVILFYVVMAYCHKWIGPYIFGS